jgi:hypothetical protein
MRENVWVLFSRIASKLGRTTNETAACLSQHKILTLLYRWNMQTFIMCNIFAAACVSSEITP